MLLSTDYGLMMSRFQILYGQNHNPTATQPQINIPLNFWKLFLWINGWLMPNHGLLMYFDKVFRLVLPKIPKKNKNFFSRSAQIGQTIIDYWKKTYLVSVVRVVENSGHRCSEFMGVGQQGGGDFSFPMLRFKHTQKYKRYSTLRE